MAGSDKKDFVQDDKGLRNLPGPVEGKRAGDSDQEKLSKSEKVIGDTMRQSALAMEVPFTMVAAIVFPGFLGYLADKWLHTSPWLMIAAGALGFISSLIDIARRYRPR
jgi:F0F1-type ATP synthase assembly protein I